jgi:NifU-like protein involved in Fe-S cluster formation
MAVITLNTTRKIDAMHFSERKKVSDQLTEEKIELLKNTGFSNKAIKLYIKEVNVGAIENANVALPFTGPCGDTCKIYLKINDQNVIEDAKFQYLGCPASAVCGSIVTQMTKGKTLREAERITAEKVIEKLGGLPGDECHCATLVLTTLFNAIKKYENNK